MPYNAGDYGSQPTPSQLQDAKPYTVGNIIVFAQDDIAGMKARLAAGDLVSVTIPVYRNFDRAGTTPIGVPDGGWSSNTFRGNHEVTLVGYDDASSAFRMVNSWGTGWGDHGFAWLSYDFMVGRSNPYGGHGSGGYAMTSLPDTIGLVGGVVTDATSNRPVAGAKVSIGTNSVTTDPSGVFTLTTPPGNAIVTVTANGYSNFQKSVAVSAGAVSSVSALMQLPVGTLAGRVIDKDTRKPIAGAGIMYDGGYKLAKTDANGNFSITLAAGAQQIRVDAPQHDRWIQTVNVTAATTSALNPAMQLTQSTLTGKVIDAATNKPITGATVTYGPVTARTDATGTFLLNTPLGVQTLTISAPGYNPWTTKIQLQPGYPYGLLDTKLAKATSAAPKK